MLTAFPDRLAEDPSAKYMSLSEYDVIIAIDPDWRELEEPQVKMLKDWPGLWSANNKGLTPQFAQVCYEDLKREREKDLKAWGATRTEG